jgi:hypothetical protein
MVATVFILFLVFQVYSFSMLTNLFNAILLLILSSYMLLFTVLVRNIKTLSNDKC